MSLFRNSLALRDISRIAGANLFASIVGITGTLIQARYVSPEQLGYFRSFGIATGYVFFLHLGIFGAFQRYYPYYIGKGNLLKAKNVARISFSWNLLISAIVGGLFFLLSLLSLFTGNWKAFLGWIVQSILIVNYFYGGHLSVLYNSTHNFRKLSFNTILSNIAIILTLPFFLIWPYIAMAMRGGLGNIVGLIYLHLSSLRLYKYKFKLKFSEWFALVKEGFPIFTASYGAGIGWTTLETSLVFLYIGTHSLGLWSISFMLFSIAKLAPQAVTAIYIPRILENYGKTHDVNQGLRLCYKPMLITTPIVLIMVLSLNYLMPIVIPIIVPKYSEAIPLINLMMFLLPIGILELPYALLIAMGKLLQQNIITFASLGVFLILGFITIQMGFGLYGIIISSIIGKIIRLITIYLFLIFTKK